MDHAGGHVHLAQPLEEERPFGGLFGGGVTRPQNHLILRPRAEGWLGGVQVKAAEQEGENVRSCEDAENPADERLKERRTPIRRSP